MNHSDTKIFCDGSFIPIANVGGYGVVVQRKGKDLEFSGAERDCTSSRMELRAAVVALQSVKKTAVIHVFSDSRYVVDGANENLTRWTQNGWTSSSKTIIANKDLWLELIALCKQHVITWNWIRGHNGHPENERADRLARMAVDELLSEGTK